MRTRLTGLIRGALERAAGRGQLGPAQASDLPDPTVESPRERGHGDLATNVAMVLARTARMAPARIAELLLENIEDPARLIESTEIAGPGFINFTLSAEAWRRRLAEILEAGESFGRIEAGKRRRVHVEFVSANPTGPLHVGHGRGAATGDALARVLEAAGHEVEREYYVNDAGRQLTLLGASIYARYLALCGRPSELPEDGYPGAYIDELAAELFEEFGAEWAGREGGEAVEFFAARGGERLLERIKRDLERFGVSFDRFTSERELRESGAVEAAMEELRRGGHVFDQDGAVWFRSTAFGDDKDRPLVKSNSELTYFAGDVAYHRDKLQRGHDLIIDVWGADHHGYVKRVESSLRALGADAGAFAVVLVQMVNLTRDGEPVRMGKRSGEFVSLAEVIDEVGPDLARFFFLMRRSDAQLDFDLELARRQTAENPVYYVQYAHTRIAGIFREAGARDIKVPAVGEAALARLGNDAEVELIKALDDFPSVVAGAAETFEPHRIVFYVQRLAGEFHRFYAGNRCVSDDAELTGARLLLSSAVKQVLGAGLTMVGVSAPERM